MTYMECYRTRIRARYAETDQMGVVHHANYYLWMEVARVDLCQAVGFRYRDLEQNHGVLLSVVESSCRYAGSARFDDEVLITTRIAHANSRIISFSYDMSVDGRHIASGETKHVCLDRDLRPTRIPAEYRPLFGLSVQ